MTRAALACLALAACYAPKPSGGAPCSDDLGCPIPQTCQRGVCSLGGPFPDASGDTAADSGPADAAPDSAPSPTTVVAGGVGAFAIDATYLYWAAAGQLWRMPKTGGNAQAIVKAGSTPESIAVDPTYIYWEDYSNDAVLEADVTGGIPTKIASGFGESPQLVVLDASNVYWPTDGAKESVMSVPKGGGVLKTLYSQPGGGGPDSIAVDTSYVYWASAGADTIYEIDKSTDLNRAIASVGAGIRDLAIDGSDIYVATTSSILRVPEAGGAVTTLASGQANITAIHLGADSVFWTNYVTDGTVMRVAKAGGTPETVAQHQPMPSWLGLDGSTLYWVTTAGLMKLDVTSP